MLHALIWIQGLPRHRGNQTSRGHSPHRCLRPYPGGCSHTKQHTSTPQGGSNPPNDVPPAQRALTQWTGSASDAWAELQRWFVPQRLHERLRWSQGHSHLPSQTSAHLLLYAGKDDATSLDSCIRKLFPDLSTELIALDIRRGGKEVERDLLRDQPYSEGTREAGKDPLDSLGGTREAPGKQEEAPGRHQGGRKGLIGQPARHQGCRKGPFGQPARHQGGRKEPFGQPGRHQGGRKDSLRGTREVGKSHLDSLGGTREAGKN